MESNFVNGVRFVADVISSNLEVLPKYEIVPPVSDALETEVRQERALLVKEQYAGERKITQGVRRTCGHSHKSVRMDHKK